ncbi:hypothetical protein [Fibrella rubiginis]|uniref:hypothetical protein n=1 Tax=Fibrella rubiginis TaxID=2817060 RepID=UPI001E37DD9E|nr:hypothetical protein [Fibrella rubiginis]
MKTKQTIAVIGATGNMGSGISRSLAKGTDRLLLFGNDQDKLQTLLADIRAANPSADVEAHQRLTDVS